MTAQIGTPFFSISFQNLSRPNIIQEPCGVLNFRRLQTICGIDLLLPWLLVLHKANKMMCPHTVASALQHLSVSKVTAPQLCVQFCKPKIEQYRDGMRDDDMVLISIPKDRVYGHWPYPFACIIYNIVYTHARANTATDYIIYIYTYIHIYIYDLGLLAPPVPPLVVDVGGV